jgi:hypothetical protein
MLESESNSEKKLRKLGERIRRGWGKTQAVTENELAVVRETVRKQWEIEQKALGKDRIGKGEIRRGQEKEQLAKSRESKPKQVKDKERGHDRSH